MNERADSGKQAAVDGFAHEHIVCGILMKKYHNVYLSTQPLSPFDVVIVRKNASGKEELTRAQIKTAKNSISFTGGTRGGVDRVYKSGVKTYTQSTKTSDVIIGVQPVDEGKFNLYFIPTIVVEKLKQKSLSLKKAEAFRNNYHMIERCKDESYINEFCTSNGILS